MHHGITVHLSVSLWYLSQCQTRLRPGGPISNGSVRLSPRPSPSVSGANRPRSIRRCTNRSIRTRSTRYLPPCPKMRSAVRFLSLILVSTWSYMPMELLAWKRDLTRRTPDTVRRRLLPKSKLTVRTANCFSSIHLLFPFNPFSPPFLLLTHPSSDTPRIRFRFFRPVRFDVERMDRFRFVDEDERIVSLR